MTCKVITDKSGRPTGFACGSSWGMGITTYPQHIGTEYESIYGYGGQGDPHDFCPDYEACTPDEIKAWEDACAACTCGREEKKGSA